MKTRNGFVSNSSSSSFILTSEKDIEMVRNHGVDVYKISDLIEILTPIVSSIRATKKRIDIVEGKLPRFMFDNISCPPYTIPEVEYESLMSIETKYPGSYITEAYDRDYASRNGWYFPTFQSDL